jgi:hypothetical protein
MFNIDELISKLQASTTDGVTINIINIGDTSDALPVEDESTLDTDFTVGMRVGVCHIKKDGTGTKHTVGTVDSFGTDDVGDYVRVTGDNGKHYKCGVKLDQERLGSKIFVILDD